MYGLEENELPIKPKNKNVNLVKLFNTRRSNSSKYETSTQDTQVVKLPNINKVEFDQVPKILTSSIEE